MKTFTALQRCSKKTVAFKAFLKSFIYFITATGMCFFKNIVIFIPFWQEAVV